MAEFSRVSCFFFFFKCGFIMLYIVVFWGFKWRLDVFSGFYTVVFEGFSSLL